MNSLQLALQDLASHRQRVEQSGPTAPATVWIDVYRPGGRDVDYARLRSDHPMFDGGKKTIGLKRVGSNEHREWELRIKRRDALAEIERRSLAIKTMLDTPIWEPE